MICTKLNHLTKYRGYSQNLDCAIDYLNKTNVYELGKGKYTINGEDVFAIVMEYETKEYNEGKFEAHQQYIDFQMILEGGEKIFSSPVEDLSIHTPYNSEEDVMFFEGKAKNECILKNGTVGIYFPEDAHMPGIALDEGRKEKVKKIVIKVRIEG